MLCKFWHPRLAPGKGFASNVCDVFEVPSIDNITGVITDPVTSLEKSLCSLKVSLSSKKIRTILLFKFKLRSSAAETIRDMCEVFGTATVNRQTVETWFKWRRAGDFDLNGAPGMGEPYFRFWLLNQNCDWDEAVS